MFETDFLSLQVVITASNVKRLQLFEDDQPDCTLLALHLQDDPSKGLKHKYTEQHTQTHTDVQNHTNSEAVCFTFQWWLCTCMRSGGVWMMFYERAANPGMA